MPRTSQRIAPAAAIGPRSIAIAIALALAAPRGSGAADRPQWGQSLTRNMVSAEKGLPDGFDPETGKNVNWSVRLGTRSYSTPAVASGRILIGTNNDVPRDPRHKGDRGVLLCLDERDGTFLWQLVVPKIEEDPYSDWPNTGIASSPTVDGDRVYLVTNRGEVACLDLDGLADGNDGPYRDEGKHMVPPGVPPTDAAETDADILWVYDVAAGVGVYQHDAAHCSVLVHGPFLYTATSNGVSGDHRRMVAPEAPSLIVLEKETGRLVARDAERMGPRTIHCTWASPSVGEVGGRPLVFFGGGDGVLYAFEALKAPAPPPGPPLAVKRVWRFDCDPEAPKEDIFKFQDNRSEGPSNITGMPVFHEGRVYVTAGGDLWHGKPKAWLKCVDASKEGDVTKEAEVWTCPLDRHCMSTPAVSGGLAFIADCGKKVRCVDARDGKELWAHQAKGEIWGSTLVADGKVYAGTQRGELIVLAASREKKVLSSIELDDAVSATPVAANGVLYVATMNRLYALAAR
ncbi:MAG: PQQ-binding-like beta-propeller repeat protein [Planctomycetes bacterium]|nr:PQQ-binding-like beta-propeller repeat protein [Planctomycetota bacterium]